MTALQKFLEGSFEVHPEGYSVQDILGESDSWLEQCHDYIQWCFPLMSPSRAVPGSPYLRSISEVNDLMTSTKVRENMTALTHRMLRFYKYTTQWLNYMDHNHLRISRIIQSLRLICGRNDAVAFLDEIMKYGLAQGDQFKVNGKSIAIWYDAAHG